MTAAHRGFSSVAPGWWRDAHQFDPQDLIIRPRRDPAFAQSLVWIVLTGHFEEDKAPSRLARLDGFKSRKTSVDRALHRFIATPNGTTAEPGAAVTAISWA